MRILHLGALILGCAYLALLSSDAQARPVPDWPFEKLFNDSTVILVVKPLPLGVRAAMPKDKPAPPCDGMTGIVTSFEVLVVVKGKYSRKQLDLLHYEYKEGRGVPNGPSPVSFPRKGAIDYLLFLKKGKDGRVEFTSGHWDPGFSVKSSGFSIFSLPGFPGH